MLAGSWCWEMSPKQVLMSGSVCAALSLIPLTIPSPAEERDHEESVLGWDGKGNPLKKQGRGKPRMKKAHVSSTLSPSPSTGQLEKLQLKFHSKPQLLKPSITQKESFCLCFPWAESSPPMSIWRQHLPRDQERFWDLCPRRYQAQGECLGAWV